MATHSRILAWEIPWTEESDGLQSGGYKELDTTKLAAEQLSTAHSIHTYHRITLKFSSAYYYSVHIDLHLYI